MATMHNENLDTLNNKHTNYVHTKISQFTVYVVVA